MQFNVRDRILLLSALPQQGDILALRAARKLREDLSFSDQELTDFQIIQTGPSFGWDRSKEQPKDIEIGNSARDMIVKALTVLSESGQLSNDHLDLCDAFIPAPAALELVG